MKLICEMIDEPLTCIIESAGEGKPKNYFIEGTFLQANIPNRNKRFYPMETLEKEVGRYVENYVNKKRAYGELGHPQGPTVNLDRVSHMFTKLERDGDNFVGRAQITNEGNGKKVRGLLDLGANLGVSSRGMGTLKPMAGGLDEVQSDYKLSTAGDIVADPSAPDAFVNGIMEGVEWTQHEGMWYPEYLERAHAHLRTSSRAEFEERTLQVWEAYLSRVYVP